ncbi:sirohydrochlorin chelatase [Rhodococcus sp. IEGM 1379]|uniref:sirohydrochlorin chelatase n=1 Tax=Rhodococcus sp. IEGM 1379 TaxID=3047086 RepID=UPI0024B71554|nr:sirohydrochlorin chelatase [Rhodococcus sp. IEGM 1379]MDI9917103.1 sirohydrochlorin chelatase [Rhodococcus sp. IEGM 1379]
MQRTTASGNEVLILVAHGTRSARGVDMLAALADAVSAQVGLTRVAFVDVLGPSPAEVLRDIAGHAVLVPAFLASGYHVHTDVRREVEASGHRSVTVTPALGPDPALARVMLRRLYEAGWQSGDAIVLAAAGSSDSRALRDVERSALMLAEMAGSRVDIGYIATGAPKVVDVVAASRVRGAPRVFIASYLLAHGLFHERLSAAGADGVTQPLGVDAGVVDLVVSRYATAREPAVQNTSRYDRRYDGDVCRPGRSGS